MTLAELIAEVRRQSNDVVQPYLWAGEDIIAWLNEAENEAAIRGRLIYESENPVVCEIAVVQGQAVYSLHPAAYEIASSVFNCGGDDHILKLVSAEWLRRRSPHLFSEADTPAYIDQRDKDIRLVPTPDRDGTLTLEVYRTPLEPMEEDSDEPEIHQAHHRHLVQWVLFRGYSRPDMETYDPNRAQLAEDAFNRHFGPPVDSDLRRITREDVPHHVEAFWP